MPVSRTVALVGAVIVLALPAVVLRGLCAGRSCEEPAGAAARVPFCSLPEEVRAGVARGFREGRSPDVLVAADGRPVAGGSAFASGDLAPEWPSTKTPAASVPLAFWGAGIDEDAAVPAGTGLEDVAPTLADVMALRRPHPEVRSGRALPGVAAGPRPRIVVEIVLAGIGARELDADPGRWRFVRRMLDRGAATPAADVGSLPLDPAAVLTTIGTGGPPAQHGIPGEILRDDEGHIARAWGRGAPPSVISTLGDDLDEVLRQRPRIGLVAPRGAYRGLIGGNWYVRVDRDDVVIDTEDPAGALTALPARGYGDDRVPDLIGVVLDGLDRGADDAVRAISAAAERAAPDRVAYALTATGSARPPRAAIDARRVARFVARDIGADVVEASAPGGLFLQQRTLARRGISEDQVIDALSTMSVAGERVFADAFPAIAVSFERYC